MTTPLRYDDNKWKKGSIIVLWSATGHGTYAFARLVSKTKAGNWRVHLLNRTTTDHSSSPVDSQQTVTLSIPVAPPQIGGGYTHILRRVKGGWSCRCEEYSSYSVVKDWQEGDIFTETSYY